MKSFHMHFSITKRPVTVTVCTSSAFLFYEPLKVGINNNQFLWQKVHICIHFERFCAKNIWIEYYFSSTFKCINEPQYSVSPFVIHLRGKILLCRKIAFQQPTTQRLVFNTVEFRFNNNLYSVQLFKANIKRPNETLKRYYGPTLPKLIPLSPTTVTLIVCIVCRVQHYSFYCSSLFMEVVLWFYAFCQCIIVDVPRSNFNRVRQTPEWVELIVCLSWIGFIKLYFGVYFMKAFMKLFRGWYCFLAASIQVCLICGWHVYLHSLKLQSECTYIYEYVHIYILGK